MQTVDYNAITKDKALVASLFQAANTATMEVIGSDLTTARELQDAAQNGQDASGSKTGEFFKTLAQAVDKAVKASIAPSMIVFAINSALGPVKDDKGNDVVSGTVKVYRSYITRVTPLYADPERWPHICQALHDNKTAELKPETLLADIGRPTIMAALRIAKDESKAKEQAAFDKAAQSFVKAFKALAKDSSANKESGEPARSHVPFDTLTGLLTKWRAEFPRKAVKESKKDKELNQALKDQAEVARNQLAEAARPETQQEAA